MRQHVPLNPYSKMPLINRQPNVILKLCLVDIPLVQSWSQYEVRLGDPKFGIICTRQMPVYFHHSFGCFSYTLQIIRGHSVFFLIGKSVVQPTRITFKRIYSTKTLKLTVSCPKKFCNVECLCYQESLFILILPTSFSL